MKTTKSKPQSFDESAQLKERISVLEQQVEWFKRQMFGSKSEKQIIENPAQDSLFAIAADSAAVDQSIDIPAHKRKSNKQFSGDEVNETGLRFDATVPTKIIDIPAPELQGVNADEYEIIDYKETTRLAQQPGSYTILIYRRPVVRHKQTQTVSAPSVPSNVLDGC